MNAEERSTMLSNLADEAVKHGCQVVMLDDDTSNENSNLLGEALKMKPEYRKLRRSRGYRARNPGESIEAMMRRLGPTKEA